MISFRQLFLLSIMFFFVLNSGYSEAATVSTSNQTLANSFVGSLAPITFDSVPGNAVTLGAIVQPVNAIDNEFQNLGLLFSSSGGPSVAISYFPDAKSDPNLLAGTSLNSSGQRVVDYAQPIFVNVVIPGTSTTATTNLFGAWIDPTGSRVQLAVYDASNNLLESVQGNAGYFIGISRSNSDIAKAVFSFVPPKVGQGFSIDDLYFGSIASPVPLPGAVILFGSGLLSFFSFNIRKLNIGQVRTKL